MTAVNGAWLAKIPSRQAPERPRRPTRRMHRIRASRTPIERATSTVPSDDDVVNEDQLPIDIFQRCAQLVD
jgi:hypothetical protein